GRRGRQERQVFLVDGVRMGARWCYLGSGRANRYAATLEQAADGFAAGARIVVAFEHFEFVALDKVLAREEGGGDFLLFDQAPEALGMDSQFAGGLHQVQVVFKRRSDRHRVSIAAEYSGPRRRAVPQPGCQGACARPAGAKGGLARYWLTRVDSYQL